uniref:Uncharacterized protein n=1 Tax=Anopheles maculatus TaxID=74869 RepID=A0A182T666_9DIPT
MSNMRTICEKINTRWPVSFNRHSSLSSSTNFPEPFSNCCTMSCWLSRCVSNSIGRDRVKLELFRAVVTPFVLAYNFAGLHIAQVRDDVQFRRPDAKLALPGRHRAERHHAQKRPVQLLRLEQIVQEADRLYRFAQAHFIGQYHRIVLAPRQYQPVQPIHLIIAQLQAPFLAEIFGLRFQMLKVRPILLQLLLTLVVIDILRTGLVPAPVVELLFALDIVFQLLHALHLLLAERFLRLPGAVQVRPTGPLDQELFFHLPAHPFPADLVRITIVLDCIDRRYRARCTPATLPLADDPLDGFRLFFLGGQCCRSLFRFLIHLQQIVTLTVLFFLLVAADRFLSSSLLLPSSELYAFGFFFFAAFDLALVAPPAVRFFPAAAAAPPPVDEGGFRR